MIQSDISMNRIECELECGWLLNSRNIQYNSIKSFGLISQAKEAGKHSVEKMFPEITFKRYKKFDMAAAAVSEFG